MKICPKCRRTYSDDNLNFCLEDGSILDRSTSGFAAETMVMDRPEATRPNSPFSAGSGAGTPGQTFSMQPKRSSKTWMWVLGILGFGVLLCGGGFAGLLFVASTVDTNSNSVPQKANSKPVVTDSPARTGDVQKVDLSRWVEEFSEYGTTEFSDGALVMASRKRGFYYVLVGSAEYTTEGASTRVSLRNLENTASGLGYGLIFHSSPSPLMQDYAFLVDTLKRKYRVVRHEPQKETVVVPWTSSEAIKDGSNDNLLEARDKGDSIELYINGQLVQTIRNTHGFKGGVAGLYSGDAAKIAFRDLEIRR